MLNTKHETEGKETIDWNEPATGPAEYATGAAA